MEPAVSTSSSVISGAAARTASCTASSRVTADDGHPWQLPSRRNRTTSSRIATSSTSPPCDPRYGRTPSSAVRTRVSTSCGCSPWTSSRLATRSSRARSSIAPGYRASVSQIPASPAP
ncbi:hypothetical protein GQ85_02555 [Rhodococcus rhodochrous]|nr:hypothetical protein GQ85_02555 [Rhodococcus rhodochrous]